LNVSWRGVLSSHLNQAGEYDKAIENAHKAIEIDENNFVPHYILGRNLRLHRTVHGSDGGG
jgi:hypothetical protein